MFKLYFIKMRTGETRGLNQDGTDRTALWTRTLMCLPVVRAYRLWKNTLS